MLADVESANARVGFWAPQPDYRIPERLTPGLEAFSDDELEAAHAATVRIFTDYQARLALHALDSQPQLDLAMFYFEQPDGSTHQYLLTDPRQPTDIRDPDSILGGQDADRRARYQEHIRTAYRATNDAVHRLLEQIGLDAQGRPGANVFVVSDHGFAPFHTAVNLNAWLAARGFDPKKVRAVTSGPAANVYINLRGREPDGIVEPDEYRRLQQDLVGALRELVDANPTCADVAHGVPGARSGDAAGDDREADAPVTETQVQAQAGARADATVKSAGQRPGGAEDLGQRIFQLVEARPSDEPAQDATAASQSRRLFGQDSGEVFALLALGYNFDGTHSPPVIRRGDAASDTPVLSLPNF